LEREKADTNACPPAATGKLGNELKNRKEPKLSAVGRGGVLRTQGREGKTKTQEQNWHTKGTRRKNMGPGKCYQEETKERGGEVPGRVLGTSLSRVQNQQLPTGCLP